MFYGGVYGVWQLWQRNLAPKFDLNYIVWDIHHNYFTKFCEADLVSDP